MGARSAKAIATLKRGAVPADLDHRPVSPGGAGAALPARSLRARARRALPVLPATRDLGLIALWYSCSIVANSASKLVLTSGFRHPPTLAITQVDRPTRRSSSTP